MTPYRTPQQKFAIDHTLYPFRSRWLTLKNGAIIHYIDEGEGPVFFLPHGNPTWSFLYRHIILGLRDKFRLIAPDYPGFGLSSAPPGYGFTAAEHADAMTELVEALALDDFTIMMQDWGGPIGLAVALRHPERVRGFVVGNTWAWPLERTGHKMFSRIMGGPFGRTIAYGFNGIVRFFMARGVASGLDEKALAMYLAPFRKRKSGAPTHIFPRQLRAARPFLAKVCEGLPALASKRALILWGEKDFAFREPERSRFEQLFPNHKTILLPEAGHFIQEDAPEKVVAAIEDWFD
jgi:haloalkane dehalogenase